MKKCRACLKIEDNTVKMCQFDQKMIGYFNLLTNLDVKLNDIMPQQICESCAGMVTLFIEFRDKCISANSFLLDINISKNIKVEERINCDNIDIKIEHIKQEVDKYEEYLLSGHNVGDNIIYELSLNNEKCEEVHSNKLQRVNDNLSTPIYSCGLCIKECNDKSLLLIHLKEHESDNESICDLCKQKFSDWHQLFSHRLEHLTNKKEKECHLCSSKFTSPPYLEFHYKKVHSLINNPILKCLPCNENFTSPQKFQRHIWNCHLENKYICDCCSWRCNDENRFKNHIAKHKRHNIVEDGKSIPCDKNNATYNTNSTNSMFQCQSCSKCYPTSITLRKHIQREHFEKQYVCDYCFKEYGCKNELKCHIERHMGHKIYACDECEYTSKFSTNLKFHKIRKHTPKRVYCTVCSRVFTDQQTLDAHKCQLKSLVCSTCGKTFKAHKQLSRHMLSHEAAGRYACERCPARYRSRSAWRAHRNRHDGVRAHACPRCPAAFYSPSVLTKHMRTHTGIKPYVCKVCQKAFTGNNNLKVHMRVHGEYLIKKKVKNEAEKKRN